MGQLDQCQIFCRIKDFAFNVCSFLNGFYAAFLYQTPLVHLGITNIISKIDETAKTELLQDYFKMQIWH